MTAPRRPLILAAALVADPRRLQRQRAAGSAPSRARRPTPSRRASGTDLTPAPSGSTEPIVGTVRRAERRARRIRDAPAATPTAETMIVRAYFVLGGEPGSAGLVPVLRVVPKTRGGRHRGDERPPGRPDGQAKPATGPSRPRSPTGRGLLGVTIKNGVATVNLSTEFDSGGGTASMQYRLAQVVYTLTQFATIKSVVFQIEGQTVTVFGSEGIVLDGPVGRADYTAQLPAIFVDRPAYGAAIGNPAARSAATPTCSRRRSGSRSSTRSGKTLVDQQVMATCGTGCRGTFDVDAASTRSARPSGGRSGCTTRPSKDGTPRVDPRLPGLAHAGRLTTGVATGMRQ